MSSNNGVAERAHVEKCPVCGTRFIGATPDDIRDHCREKYNPLGALYVFRRNTNDS